ncbi:MAG TPA: holo-ACP synthase [Candidatus Marinimicrobia bacterium]|nr:holo-ACP synthase [Candidatus Neomarinimicrobiota bacterium]HRS90700.1 holo-ACP synthase [Candidatus Neomarinimicrobiota bacterium]
MIYGIGIDLIEVERIARQVAGETHFREKIFSPNEITYCEDKPNQAEHYAARFAAKEALFKALGTGWRSGLNFAEVEVLNDELGKPAFNFLGKTSQIIEELNPTRIHLSLSHLAQIAVAIVIIEK